MIPVDPPYCDPAWLPASQVDCYRAGWTAARQALINAAPGPVDASGEPVNMLEQQDYALIAEAIDELLQSDITTREQQDRIIRWAKATAAAVPSSPAQPLSVAETQRLLGSDRPISIGKVPTDPIGMRAIASIVASLKHGVFAIRRETSVWMVQQHRSGAPMKLILLSVVAAIVLAAMLYREVRETRAYNEQQRRCIAYATASVPDVDAQAWCQP